MRLVCGGRLRGYQVSRVLAAMAISRYAATPIPLSGHAIPARFAARRVRSSRPLARTLACPPTQPRPPRDLSDNPMKWTRWWAAKLSTGVVGTPPSECADLVAWAASPVIVSNPVNDLRSGSNGRARRRRRCCHASCSRSGPVRPVQGVAEPPGGDLEEHEYAKRDPGIAGLAGFLVEGIAPRLLDDGR